MGETQQRFTKKGRMHHLSLDNNLTRKTETLKPSDAGEKSGWSCFEVSVLRQHTDQQAGACPLRRGALHGAGVGAGAAAHNAAPCKITQCSIVS